MSNDELSKQIEGLCNSKAEEFEIMGYEHISGKDIWKYVSEKYGEGELPPIHKIVNDILTMKITAFMNWMTLNAYKGVNDGDVSFK